MRSVERNPETRGTPVGIGIGEPRLTGIHEWTEHRLSASRQPRDDDVLRDFLIRFGEVLPQETAPSKR